MNQAAKIEGMITDINLMDWDDGLHAEFTEATESLKTLLIALQNKAGDAEQDRIPAPVYAHEGTYGELRS
mgnify:CR=1 FL=1